MSIVPGQSHFTLPHDVSHVRQIFAPTMAFEHATILRGTFEPLKVRYRHTAGVLFLWRKKDNTKLYIQSHPFDDLSKLVESTWSCVLFWNSDGPAPSKPAQTPILTDTVGALPAPPIDEHMSTPNNNMPGDIPDEPFLAPLTPVQPDTPVVPTALLLSFLLMSRMNI